MATKKKNNGIDEMDRLQLFNQQLKIRALNSQLQAVEQRQNAIAVELEVLPAKKAEIEKQRDELLGEYQTAYGAMKEAAGVPDGHELNLETGEVVQVKQQ